MSKNVTNYPPASGKYKICINGHANWRDYDSCRIQISVGNPKYEGDKFSALAEWCAHRFQHVTLVVSDTLQRYNLAQQTEDDAYEKSLADGEQWLWRNRKAISGIPQAQVTRWDEWLNHPDFLIAKQEIESQFSTGILSNEIEKIIAQRLAQPHAKAPPSCVRAFLVEEYSVFACQEEVRAINVYAGTPYNSLLDGLKGKPGILYRFDSAQWLEVDMAKNKGFRQAA